jgi:ribosome maturation protein Sdo1
MFSCMDANVYCISEKNVDDVLQIANVFVNVSKGEVAKSNDIQKAFGTSDTNTVIAEVLLSLSPAHILTTN